MAGSEILPRHLHALAIKVLAFDACIANDDRRLRRVADEISVRLHASSLNYHDYRVVSGVPSKSVGRSPMADGAGVVEAVGDGVADFAVGDNIVSTFFPTWLDGPLRWETSPRCQAMVWTAMRERS
jgi:D-arabinose 1-dehydrogenase-like Zn-dependent alcohol dehydrogenase